MARRSVAVVLGTRPEAIKLAPVIEALKARPDDFECIVIATGQHREMLQQILTPFGIVPDHDLELMEERQTLERLAGRTLVALGPVLRDIEPDAVLVQGDTTTALASALAAFYRKVPVGHVEAGLRSGDLALPFPEEANRRLISHIAEWHFAPTQQAAECLAREDIASEKVFTTGNTVVDAVLAIASRPWEPDAPELSDALSSGRRLLLATAHRRESWGEDLACICRGLRAIVAEYPDVQLVFACHRNPIVRDGVASVLDGEDRVLVTEPLDYLPFVKLMQASDLIVSDSGGVQEEATTLGRRMILVRNVTERPEALESGCVRLVGTTQEAVIDAARDALAADGAWEARACDTFGDGRASERIAAILAERLA